MVHAKTPLTYHFTLLRHGQSVGNAENFHQGQSDFPLTETGRQQAHALADRWQAEAKCFDLVISSPLMRARQTAEIIAQALNLPLEYDPEWMERDAGLLSGLHLDDAEIIYPRPPFIHPFEPIGESGESQWELYLRAGRALQNLLYRDPGSYLIVSHGAILNMVMYAILGIAPQANFQGPHFRFRNTSFTTLVYNPSEHDWLLESLNDRLHWPGDE